MVYGFIIVFSTSKVQSMSLSRRDCIIKNEDLEGTGIVMEAFKNYSRPNCLLECRARLMFDRCGCLPFFYPEFSRVWGESTTCSREGLACLSNTTGNYNEKIDMLAFLG